MAAVAAAAAAAAAAADADDGDVTAPDFVDPDASLSSTAAHKSARRGRKAERAKQNAAHSKPAAEHVARDRKMAKESLDTQHKVFEGSAPAAAAAAAAVPQPGKRSMAAILSVRDTLSKDVVPSKDVMSKASALYNKHVTSSTTTAALLQAYLYSKVVTASVTRADGTVVDDPIEARRMIDAHEHYVPEYTVSHIRLLSRQCGYWELVPNAGTILYPGCSNPHCVIAYDPSAIANLHPEKDSDHAGKPIILLSPKEIGDAMAVKRASKETRVCFWCACAHFGNFLMHYRDAGPCQIPLPDTEAQQVFRVRCDAVEGFHSAYLLPYTNGTKGGGIVDGVPRADIAMMSAEYVGERYVLNFDRMCFQPRVPGDGGTAWEVKERIERDAQDDFAALDDLLPVDDEQQQQQQADPEPPRSPSPPPLPLQSRAAKRQRVEPRELGSLSKFCQPVAVAAAPPSRVLKFCGPFHNANSRVETTTASGDGGGGFDNASDSSALPTTIAAALHKYRPILAKLCRGGKRDVRGGGGGGAGKASKRPAAASKKDARDTANRMAAEPMMVSMNPVLLRSRSECRRRVAGLFASLHTLAVVTQDKACHHTLHQLPVPLFRLVRRVADVQYVITRYAKCTGYVYVNDCPRFSDAPDGSLPEFVRTRCTAMRKRADVCDALYDACIKADAGRLHTVIDAHPNTDVKAQFLRAFRQVIHDSRDDAVLFNAFRFAIVYMWWTAFRRCASEFDTLKANVKKTSKDRISAREYRRVGDLLSAVDHHLAVNMDVFWYVCYSMLARVYARMPCTENDTASVCPAFRVHTHREDVFDPLYDSQDVIDDMTLPVIAESMERSFMDSVAQSKRVPLTHILDKCLPRRSSWRMGEGVTNTYMKDDDHFRTYAIQVVVCALLGNYSDIKLGFRARWKTRCMLYHSYYQATGSTGARDDDPWLRRAQESKSSLFKALIGGINRFCLHAFHRHMNFVARTNPHIEWALRKLFAYDALMMGADDVLAGVRDHAVAQTDVLLQTFETGASDARAFEKRQSESHKMLQKASKAAEKESKTVLEVVPLPKKLGGFVNAVQTLVGQIPILGAKDRDALERERKRHRSVPLGHGISAYRYATPPADADTDTDDGDDDSDGSDDDEDAMARMAANAPGMGNDDDGATGSTLVEHDAAAAPAPVTELTGSFRTKADFGLPRKLVSLIEKWVSTHCNPAHKFPEAYIFELLEAMCAPSKTSPAIVWLQQLSRQFQLEVKIKDDLTEFAKRHPFEYAIMQTFCVFYRRLCVLQVVPLPAHYRDAQIAAGRARFNLPPGGEDTLPDSAHVVKYCTVCLRVFNIVREHIGPGHVFGKDGGYVNVTTCVDFSNPDNIIFHCNGRDTFAGRSCMTEPLARISLLGRALIYRGEVITLCPQPDCGCPSVMCGTRSVFTSFGAACGDCSLCIAAASLELQANGKSPLTSIECFAARHLIALDRRARETNKPHAKKRTSAAATASTSAGGGGGGTFSALELRAVCDQRAREQLTAREAELLMAKANVGGALRCQICETLAANVAVRVRTLFDVPVAICDKHKTMPMMGILRDLQNGMQKHVVRVCPVGRACVCNGFRDHTTCDGKLNVVTLVAFLQFYIQPGALTYAYGHARVYNPRRRGGGGGNGKRAAAAAAAGSGRKTLASAKK